MGRVTEIEATLPDPALPDADWADAYQAMPVGEYANAREAGEAVIAGFPKWTTAMLVVRQIIVAPFGLKGVKDTPAKSRIGIFPVVTEDEEKLVAGFNDKHLDFRIVIRLEGEDASRSITLATLIKRHNLLGRIYLQLVLPFHRAIIRSALKKLVV